MGSEMCIRDRENDISVSALARFPEVLTMEEQVEDEEELWNGLKKALEGAFTQFVETRITEGENLKKDILAKLTFLEQEVSAVEERSPQIVAEYRQKLEAVSYTHLRAHETDSYLVCRLLLEKKKKTGSNLVCRLLLEKKKQNNSTHQQDHVYARHKRDC